jgi:hypothetical protein
VAIEDHGNVVAAARQIFGVQGLMDVADEVQDELQGFVAGAEGVGGVEEEGGLWGCYFVFEFCFMFRGRYSWWR